MSLPDCPHRPPCPGCPRFGESGIDAAAAGALAALADAHGLPAVPLISGRRAAFRMRARLAIRGRLGGPKLGLFELGTHRVVHIPHCQVHHPLINRVAAVVRRALADAGVSSYSDKAHLGLARYLQVVVERTSQTAQVVIVGNSESPAPLSAGLDLIRERLGPELHSLWYNANVERTNSIMGADFHRLSGPPAVVENFGGAAVHYPPGAFGQSNLDVAQMIIDNLRAEIPSGARVAEFYAGVGAIGLSLLSDVGGIQMNEVSPQSLLGLQSGLAELAPEARRKVTVVAGAAASAREIAAGAEVVIADPPRRGLDPELTEMLATQSPGRFLYVSCGLDSFLSDTARLTAGGKLALGALTAFDLMPYTGHVELLARFDRR